MFTKKSLLFLLSFLIFISNVNAAEYFISPTGDDNLNGESEGTAIETFDHAYDIMDSGDTLTLLDGTYNQQLFPPVSISGTDGNYTTFRAKNLGKAIIAPNSEEILRGASPDNSVKAPLFISSNYNNQAGYFHIDGLFIKGIGEHNAVNIHSQDFSNESQMTHHIKLTRIGAFGSAVDTNTVVFGIGMSRDVLIEDCFAFGFGRKAMQAYGSIRIIIRRVVLRFDWWEGDNYKPNDPRTTISIYNTIDSIIENIIIIDAGPEPLIAHSDRSGLAISGNDADGTTTDGSHDVQCLGSIVFSNRQRGFNAIEINGGSGNPASDVVFENIIIWNNESTGLNIQGNMDNVTLRKITTAFNGGSGIRVDPYPHRPITNTKIDNIISKNNERGYWFGYGDYNNNCEDFSAISYCSNITAVNNTEGDTITSTATGAIVQNKYVNGILTNTSLWPYPNENYIKEYMCNSDLLEEIENKINDYDGTNVDYIPGFCQNPGTLTEYLNLVLENNAQNINFKKIIKTARKNLNKTSKGRKYVDLLDYLIKQISKRNKKLVLVFNKVEKVRKRDLSYYNQNIIDYIYGKIGLILSK